DRVHVINGNEWQLLLLADGMGGYGNGNLAAELAIHLIEENFSKSANDAIEKINDIFAEANDLIDEKVSGAGTTIGGVLVRGKSLNIFWAGDVRIYIKELGGLNTQYVTKDHTLAQLMKDSNVVINPSEINRLRNTVTRALGGNSSTVLPDAVSLNLLANFKGLICSDGIHGLFSDSELFELLSDDKNLAILDTLQDRVDIKGKDNASAIVFSIMTSN
ncbi:MAG: PP2C family protein-serine/threonine phosphatase, partial [Cyclobacteriaceae bacterium]